MEVEVANRAVNTSTSIRYEEELVRLRIDTRNALSQQYAQLRYLEDQLTQIKNLLVKLQDDVSVDIDAEEWMEVLRG